MAQFASILKNILSRSARCIKRNVGRFIQTLRFKHHELRAVRQRRKAVRNLGEAVYAASQNGITLSEAAAGFIQEISRLDKELESLRNDCTAQKATYAQQRAEEKAARTSVKASEKATERNGTVTVPIANDSASYNQTNVQEHAEGTVSLESTETSPSDTPTLKL